MVLKVSKLSLPFALIAFLLATAGPSAATVNEDCNNFGMTVSGSVTDLPAFLRNSVSGALITFSGALFLASTASFPGVVDTVFVPQNQVTITFRTFFSGEVSGEQ
jgi:hypothetical protein